MSGLPVHGEHCRGQRRRPSMAKQITHVLTGRLGADDQGGVAARARPAPRACRGSARRARRAPGHEVAGVVQTVGAAVTNVAPGDRVVATITPSCGLCPACLRGRPTQCARVEQTRRRERPKLLTSRGDEVTVLGDLGGFAEAFLASERSLARIPPGIAPAVACLLGCCVSTGVGAALHGAKITAEDTVAVIGCGGVGIAAIQGAWLAGARRIVAVDAAAGKLPVARRFGASDAVLADAD